MDVGTDFGQRCRCKGDSRRMLKCTELGVEGVASFARVPGTVAAQQCTGHDDTYLLLVVSAAVLCCAQLLLHHAGSCVPGRKVVLARCAKHMYSADALCSMVHVYGNQGILPLLWVK